MDSFKCILLKLAELLESVSLCLLPNLRHLRPFFLNDNDKMSALFLLPFWNSDDIFFSFCHTGYCGYIHLKNKVFSLLFRLGNFNWSVFKLTNSFLYHFHSATGPILMSLFKKFQLFCFPALKFPLGSSLYLLCICYHFLSFICF